MYGVLGFLVARAKASARRSALVAIVAACSAFGALDEWHQLYIPGRSGSVDDWGADSLGGALGVAAFAAAARRRREPTT